MSPQNNDSKPSAHRRYLFKITVVGPDDSLLEEILEVFGTKVVSVDGIRIGAAGLETDDTKIRTLIMSPQDSALDVLLSMTYAGANAVIIVLREADPEVEAHYRNEVRENVGSSVPTRVAVVGERLDEQKRNEMSRLFTELVEEILQSRQ